MAFTELQIKPTPLYFVEMPGKEYVIIGVNRINKQFYHKHEKTFNKIIKFGDEAWNKTIDTQELAEFAQRLDEQQETLQLVTD